MSRNARRFGGAIIVASLLAIAACGGSGSSGPIPPNAITTPVQSPTAAPSVSPAASPTVNPTASPTVTPTASPTPSPTPTPAAILLVADGVSRIYEFALPLKANSTPFASFAGRSAPYGMAFDPMHRLFVANSDGTVQVFTPPLTNGASPSFTLTTANPPYIAIDGRGTAYMLTAVPCGYFCGNPAVEEFAAPVSAASPPTLLFTMKLFTRGLALDATGNLWTAEVFRTILGIECSLQEFSPPFTRTTTAAQTVQLGTCDGEPFGFGIAFDARDDLFVNDADGNIDMFPVSAGGTYKNNFTPLGGSIRAYGLAFDKQNNLYATTLAGTLEEFSPPFSAANAPVVTLALPGAPAHAGVAVSP